MGIVVISIVGNSFNSLYAAIKEFSVDKIILIYAESKKNFVDKIKSDLKRFGIPVETIKIKNNLWEETFRTISKLSRNKKNVIVDCTSNSSMQSAAISAAFVNGLRAFILNKNEMVFLPTINANYYDIISKQKMKILKIISERDSGITQEELSKKTNMSLPLISYHVNGTPKAKGLKAMGLLKSTEKAGRVVLELTQTGKTLAKAYG
jgi:hypothetical protein